MLLFTHTFINNQIQIIKQQLHLIIKEEPNLNKKGQTMKNNYNTNSSLFSLDYKINYESSKIAEHLQESQTEISFIKVKLTEAYSKLESEIHINSNLEEENQQLMQDVQNISEKYAFERKENGKLKQTLEVILKNRKMLQEEIDSLKELIKKKNVEKDHQFQQLKDTLEQKENQITEIKMELEEKNTEIKQQKLKQEKKMKEKQKWEQKAMAFTTKISWLQNQIKRVSQEKVFQINRLLHEIQLYQREITTLQRQTRLYHPRDNMIMSYAIPNHIRGLSPYQPMQDGYHMEKSYRKKQIVLTNSEDQEDSQCNKENVQKGKINKELISSNIAKWKTKTTHNSQNQTQTIMESSNVTPFTDNFQPKDNVAQSKAESKAESNALSDDQKLTFFQMKKKKIEHELAQLDRIKRHSPEERLIIDKLEKQIYQINSQIAGLKRKIRRKY